ncbi:hypothetical protein Rs2_32314 [Raphanus sativus]|uniref:Uncharacterized protein LOC108839895 n=1 Tax=Raphanus sativus TaxID=3726 RepID=A0A6J0M9A5_RAPSA|nr:uncharacterized protein LOC108839895 [Raphanus sativus]KAJ4892566.1 hypothetical protein Rs2_32314 [Raphanus sativus]
MANNSQSSSKNQEKKKKGNRVCEKIFRAVTSPVRTVRRISTKPSPNQHHEAEVIRVRFSGTAKPVTNIEQKKTLITRVETTLKTDERFTDYIKKAKLKIGAMTMNDDVPDTSEKETRDHHPHHVPISRVSRESSSGRSSDRFSEYINKAKMKLRSSSTIVRANTTHNSFKY